MNTEKIRRLIKIKFGINATVEVETCRFPSHSGVSNRNKYSIVIIGFSKHNEYIQYEFFIDNFISEDRNIERILDQLSGSFSENVKYSNRFYKHGLIFYYFDKYNSYTGYIGHNKPINRIKYDRIKH